MPSNHLELQGPQTAVSVLLIRRMDLEAVMEYELLHLMVWKNRKGPLYRDGISPLSTH